MQGGDGREAVRPMRSRLRGRFPHMRPLSPLLPAVGRHRVPAQKRPGAHRGHGGEGEGEFRDTGIWAREHQETGDEADASEGPAQRR